RAQAQGVVCSGTCLSQGRNHIGCHQGSTQCQANNCPTFSYHCMSPELAEYSCFTLVRTQIETGLAILRKPRRNDPPRASSTSMDGTGTWVSHRFRTINLSDRRTLATNQRGKVQHCVSGAARA